MSPIPAVVFGELFLKSRITNFSRTIARFFPVARIAFLAAAGGGAVRGPVAVCLRRRGPWGGCAGEADAVGIWRKGGRVLAGKRFLLARQQP